MYSEKLIKVSDDHNYRERLSYMLTAVQWPDWSQSAGLFMMSQPRCIVWSELGLELKLVSLFSNNQVNSGAKTKAADL